MKDHSVTPEKLYPTMPDEPNKVYPYITLPAGAFDKGYQPGDECCITIYVKIKDMNEGNFGCELTKSEDCTEEEEKE